MVKDRLWQAFQDTGDPVYWVLYRAIDPDCADDRCNPDAVGKN